MDLTPAARAIRELFVSSEVMRARAARTLGRSPVELSALIQVSLGSGITPNMIANRLSLTTGSVTALLDRLQSAGLIERTANPDDRRSLLIVVTPPGLEVTNQFLLTLDGIVTEALRDVDEARADTFRDLLGRVTSGLSEYAAAPSDVPTTNPSIDGVGSLNSEDGRVIPAVR